MPIHDWTQVSSGLYHDFHLEWISTIKSTLNDRCLPPDFYAMAEQVAGGYGPDVIALEVGNREDFAVEREGGLAVATAPVRVEFVEIEPEGLNPRRRNHLTIRHSSNDRVVAIIEIVSPGNKAGQAKLDAFVRKAVEFLNAGVHLLVLDLFPPGPWDANGIHPAIWSQIGLSEYRCPQDKPLTMVSYRADVQRVAYVEPVGVGDPLPEMPLFFLPDRYVLVPLESTYQEAFRRFPRRWREVVESPRPGHHHPAEIKVDE